MKKASGLRIAHLKRVFASTATEDHYRPAVRCMHGHAACDEVLGKRSAVSKTFRMESGEFKVIVSKERVHYEDANGVLQEIDLTIQNDGARLYMDRAGYKVEVFTDRVGYHLELKDGSFDIELVAIGGQPVDNSKLSVSQDTCQVFWDGVHDDVSFKILLQADKPEVFTQILNDTSPRELEWLVTQKGDFSFSSFGGDSEGNALEIKVNRIDRSPDSFSIIETWTGRCARIADKKTRQKKWFDDPVYPVVIDPTVTINIAANADDGYELESYAAWSATYTLFFGVGGPANRYSPGFRFQTVGVPAGATVSSATLKFTTGPLQQPHHFNTITAKVWGDKVGNAAAWSSTSRPTQITKTAASTNVSPSFTIGAVNSVNVTTQVASIVSLGGWANNNAMRFGILSGYAAGSGATVQIYRHETNAAKSAQLVIVYSTITNTTITPGAGALTLLGAAGSLGFKLTPGVGALAMSGFPPSVIRPTVITPGAGSLSTSGLGSVLDLGMRPGAGTLTIAGTSSTTAFSITPGAGSLSISGAGSVLDLGIKPAAGALALSGQASTTAFTITPGAGSLSMSGAAPRMDLGIKPGAGALVIGGLSPTLSTGFVLTPGAGSLVISGQTPGVLGVGTIQPGAGALGLAGYAPSLGIGVTPGVGALSLVGAGSVLGLGMKPGAGSLSMVGSASVIGIGVMPGTGTLTATGSSPSMGFGIKPGAGSLSLSGALPVIGLGIVPGAGSLAIVGSPTVVGLGIVPGAGALTAAGFSPSMGLGIQPGAGSLSLSGAVPVLGYGMTPGTGTLALTGLGSRLDFRMVPGVGSLQFNGYPPTTGVSGPIVPAAGALGFTGYAPLVIGPGSFTITPGAGALVITGYSQVDFVTPSRTFNTRPHATAWTAIYNKTAWLAEIVESVWAAQHAKTGWQAGEPMATWAAKRQGTTWISQKVWRTPS